MTPETIVDLVFTGLVTGGLGVLLWKRLDGLETGQAILRREVADIRERMATRDELARLRGEMTTELSGLRGEMTTELSGLRGEMTTELSGLRGEMSAMRSEMAVMRSDLTHVALAVGVNRPKPLEG
jgi:hypothetical protein